MCPDIGLDKGLLDKGETLTRGEKRTFVITAGIQFTVGTPYTIIVRAEGRSPFGGKRDKTIIVTAVRA